MSEQSRMSGQWQQPPRRLGKISDDELATIDAAAERFNLICYVGCGAGAFAAIAAAAVAWAEPIARFIGALL